MAIGRLCFSIGSLKMKIFMRFVADWMEMMSFPAEMQRLSTELVTTIEGSIYSSFRDFPKRSLYGGKVCDVSRYVNAICSRPEVVDVVIFIMDVDTFRYYACNF